VNRCGYRGRSVEVPPESAAGEEPWLGEVVPTCDECRDRLLAGEVPPRHDPAAVYVDAIAEFRAALAEAGALYAELDALVDHLATRAALLAKDAPGQPSSAELAAAYSRDYLELLRRWLGDRTRVDGDLLLTSPPALAALGCIGGRRLG
jgi:hypothetical protein